MKPIAVAMEFLQDKRTFLLHVIPTVMGIQGKLRAVVVDTTKVPLTVYRVAFVLCLLVNNPVGINADPKI